jgi:iron(III) transport system substrate-binding protein
MVVFSQKNRMRLPSETSYLVANKVSRRNKANTALQIVLMLLGLHVLLIGGILLLGAMPETRSAVIVYTSQDEVYAQPILSNFTKQTGVQVKTVYDSEAVKTVGLVNRLIAEKNRPQCDVFWNNEEMRTRQLEAAGVLRETNAFVCFGFRSRRIVFNTNLVKEANAPLRVAALTNKAYFGKIALAYPLFGTTSTHFLALRQAWGEAAWLEWCRALQANKPFVVDGNSSVVKLVGKGEAAIGLTDSDDVRAGRIEGLPIDSMAPATDGFFIGNSVAVIRNAPHPVAAQQLMEYLTSDDAQNELEKAGAIEPKIIQPSSRLGETDWAKILDGQSNAVNQLKGIFLR